MTAALKSEALGKLVLRLTLGILILFHGVSKLMHSGDTIAHIGGMLSAAHLPAFIVYGVFIGEVLAPILIILGIFSRVGGLIVVINMIFALC